MTGLNLKLPMSFTNTALPILRDDPVLPNAGALMLIDPAHPANPWAAGVPADGALLPNLAGDQALSLYGAAAADIQPKMINVAGFTGTAGKIERTVKGGLHGISPKSGTAVAGAGAGVIFTPKMLSYILANPKHDYYMSMWFRTTREPLAGFNNSQLLSLNGSGQQTNSYLFNVAANSSAGPSYPLSVRPVSGTPRLGFRESGETAALGNKFVSMATDQYYTQTTTDALPGDGTNTAVTGSQFGGGIAFGNLGNWLGVGSTGIQANGTFNPGGNSSNKDKNASQILYRFYLEDLTVSGRSYATVDALSWAAYQKQVLTAGGRYYADTFTDPTTIP